MADTYVVTAQRPVQDVTPGGTFEDAYEITFTTRPSDVPGKVRVPVSAYSADHVDRILSAQAAVLEQVQHL